MRYPLKPASFAELLDAELVQAREFLNSTEDRGYVPFGQTTMKTKIKAGTFPAPDVASEAGGTASLWRAGRIKKWKREYDAERLKGVAA